MGKVWPFLAVYFATSTVAFASPQYSVLQGSTSETVANFTVMAGNAEDLHFQVRALNQPSLVTLESSKVSYPGSPWVVHRINAKGLAPNTPYVLEIVDAHQNVVESRNFESLDTTKTDGRLAVGSCMVRQLHNPYLWSNLSLPENRPDLLIINGDALYLDRANVLIGRPPKNGLEVWDEFVKSRQTVGLYFWEKLVPTITIWDDHDSGGDNVDASFKLMPEIRKIYETFFANDEIPGFLEHGPAMAKNFKLFGKNFIMLDGRSFRNINYTRPLFGEEQERWMLRKIQGGANVLVSGSQFFGKYIAKDSLEGNWPRQAREFFERLRNHGVYKSAAFAFISGDVHFSEVQDIEPEWFGYPTVEITSSNIHSFGFPGHFFLKHKNPRRREVTGTHNIVLLEFSAALKGFAFNVRALGWRGWDLFRTSVNIEAPMISEAANSDGQQDCEKILASGH